jgi:hypothetical protein
VAASTGRAVGFAAVTYAGTMTLGLTADLDVVPDLETLRSGVRDSLDELSQLAGGNPGEHRESG